MTRPPLRRLWPLLLLGPWATPVAGCGACGCTLYSDWAGQGYAHQAGLRMDLRQDYFVQDQLRSGSSAPPRSNFALPNDQEIQQRTINRNTTLGLDYSSDHDWGLNLMIPYFNRFHSTIAPGDTEVSTSRGSGLGDIRLTARYQGFDCGQSLGVQLGLKLPTGAFRDTFREGPQAGAPLDRGLQLGTGTTDLLAGIYKYGATGFDWSYFAQVALQLPLNTREDFRPGNGLNASLGLRCTAHPVLIPQVQLNLRAEGRESGASADRDNSGATLVYFSPGLAIQASPALQLQAFFQVPVLQRVNGLQLEPRSSFSLGAHYSF